MTINNQKKKIVSIQLKPLKHFRKRHNTMCYLNKRKGIYFNSNDGNIENVRKNHVYQNLQRRKMRF